MKMHVAILLICSASCVLAQYHHHPSVDDAIGGSPITPPKKSVLQIPRRIKQQPARLTSSPTSQTSIINQRFRRPIPINKPRPASEPIPELPVFTSGIRGSRPSSASALNYEQNDDASTIPIQTIQQPHIVHAQSVPEFKPVSEENEKDEDVVQVIANLGAVSAFGAQGNLLTPTAAPIVTPSSTINSFLEQQQQQLNERQQHQQQNDRQQQELDRQQQQADRQRQQIERQHQQIDRQHHLQQRFEKQQIPAAVQYRPAPQISRSTPTYVPEQQIHQVVAPVQYRPQKPVRLQQKQQQQIAERNEYDLNEARPVKQRTHSPPKKTKGEYYEGGRTKKPVAQVIRRYREETADGSIIWGFENDDGSFKEEIIGIDCITRGKYGYVDPDGLRREYTYETGIKCDEDTQKQQDQDILNTFVDYQENKLVLPSGKTIDLSTMGKKQARRPPHIYRN